MVVVVAGAVVVVVPSFWVNDFLAEGAAVPWGYVGGCAAHALLYAAVGIVLATVIATTRELEGRSS